MKFNITSICIGNRMISSTIWDKSARVNFSKANQIAQARRASAICSLEKFTSADLSLINFHLKWMTNKPCLYVAYLSDSFKHNEVVGLWKIQIPLGNFKAFCHVLSGAFIFIQLY